MISDASLHSNTKKGRVACVDLGSSYFRLLVADRGGAGDEVAGVSDHRAYVGWGEHAGAEGGIPRRLLERASQVLCGMIGTARASGAGEIAVVSTNTLRTASNGTAAASFLADACGESVRVLSQREEAFLTYAAAVRAGVRQECGVDARYAVVVDVGGTSTEISWGRGTRPAGFTGIGAGAHTLRARRKRPGGEGQARRMAAEARDLVDSQWPPQAGPGSAGRGHYPLPERP